MSGNDPKRFDPARAHVLDAPERERYLPTDVIVALLDLQGDETVVDYGAGTGRITIPVAHLLRDGGRVVAVAVAQQRRDARPPANARRRRSQRRRGARAG